MKKSIHRPEYPVLCGVLREIRTQAGLTQVDLAKKLRKPQTFVSAVELGKIRLDFLQLRDWCRACKATTVDLGTLFEKKLQEGRRQPTAPAPAKRKART